MKEQTAPTQAQLEAVKELHRIGKPGIRRYDDPVMDFAEILWRSEQGHIIGTNDVGDFLLDEPMHFDDKGKDRRTYVQQRHRSIITRETALHRILCLGVPVEFRPLLNRVLDQLEKTI